MNIVFLGTASNSGEILTSLIENKKNVVLVVTNLTSLGNRGKPVVPEVKLIADKHNIFCYQTDNVSSEESVTLIKKYKPDLFVTAAFSQFLKQNFLDLAPTINVHPSLLPKYRGATPIQSAIINGETVTGVSVLKTVLKMDAGDILLQEKLEIKQNETSGELSTRLWGLGKKLIINAVNQIEKGTVKFIPQNNDNATFCKKFKKEDAKLNFNLDAPTLKNQILGYNPWPVSFSFYENKLIKIYKAEVENNQTMLELFSTKNAGDVVSTKKEILILCGKNTILKVLELQIEGGKILTASQFLNGKKLNGRLD